MKSCIVALLSPLLHLSSISLSLSLSLLPPSSLSLSHQVKIKRSYPLTSIEDVKYSETDSTTFEIIFATYIMTLQADTAEEAKDWVKAINDGECYMERLATYVSMYGALEVGCPRRGVKLMGSGSSFS